MLYRIGCLISGVALFVSCGNNPKIEQQSQEVKKDTATVKLSECESLFKEAKQSDDILLRATVVNPDVAKKAIIAFYNFDICHKTQKDIAQIKLYRKSNIKINKLINIYCNI